MKTKFPNQSNKYISVLSGLLVCAFILLCTTSNAQWTQVGADIDGEAELDHSGQSVSLSADGTIVAIGANYNDGINEDAGHVRVYQLISGIWIQLGEDIEGEAAYDNSGYSVSLSADGLTLAIGAHLNDENGYNSGHVRVYKFISETWVQLGEDLDGEAQYDQSGRSIGLSADGSTIAIGARYNVGSGINETGHVRVYKLIAGTWMQQGEDIDGESDEDIFGFSVSLCANGSKLAIGAPENNGNGSNSGHTRVYEYIAGEWIQIGDDIDGEAEDDWSGRSVCLSADGLRVAIMANWNDGNGSGSGHVRVFQQNSGIWTQLGEDIDGEAEGDTSSGGYSSMSSSVCLNASGSRVAIGAPYNDGNGWKSGHVRVFELVSGMWIQLGIDLDGEFSQDLSGSSVSLSTDGNVVAIGAPWNDGNGDNSGHVRVYSYSDVGVEENVFGSDFVVYPNPSLGEFSVKLDKVYDELSVSITDINGKIIQTNTFSSRDLIQLEINEPAGVYLLRLESGDREAVIELIKE